MIRSGRTFGPVVLLVDDDHDVLESQADLLRKECRVIGTSDVGEAIALLGSEDVALILADQRMPGMTGTDLLARAAQQSPSTVRILMTAYSDIEAVIEAINRGHVFYYFTKPWDAVRLIEAVRTALETHRLLLERQNLLADLDGLVRSEPAGARLAPSDDVDRLRIENGLLGQSLAQIKQTFLHLQRIQEVVPVCVTCGKIKTGDASWEPVLQYLKNHASFLSHGYCPSCMEQARLQWKGSRLEGSTKPVQEAD